MSRLRSIDALRGAAALAVVLYHAVGQAPRDETSAFIQLLAVPVRVVSSYGYAGVFLFFVISGFCIHLHWAKARVAAISIEPKVAFVPFWKRRIFRLYPPYLIALALYLLWTAVNSGIEINGFFVWDMTLHLLMLHNFDSHTVYSINGVFWTLAIEEQLYLAYFLLLFIRRRWGWKWTLITCAAARVGWLVLCVGLQRAVGLVDIPVPESAASHWFTWALGALSVEAMLGLVALPRWCRDMRVGAAALASAVGLSHILPLIAQHSLWHANAWLLLHPLWGLGFFILVNRFVLAERNWGEWLDLPRLVRWSATVGLFSYSLYLIHQLVLMEMWRFWILRMPSIIVALLVMVPLCVACAYVFFRYCERPFLPPPVRPATLTTPSHHGTQYTPDPLINGSTSEASP